MRFESPCLRLGYPFLPMVERYLTFDRSLVSDGNNADLIVMIKLLLNSNLIVTNPCSYSVLLLLL